MVRDTPIHLEHSVSWRGMGNRWPVQRVRKTPLNNLRLFHNAIIRIGTPHREKRRKATWETFFAALGSAAHPV